MAKDLFWTVTTFAILVGILVLTFWPQNQTMVVVKYDCRQLIGGWHPDIPATVQEECRKRSTK
jgi:uncharacterized integral membrane protein